MKHKSEEFYVGYHEAAPAALAGFIRKTVAGLLFIAAALALVLVSGQSAFYPSFFEFGVVNTFEGTISEKPYPVLFMQRPGETASAQTAESPVSLVAFGKFGAEARVAGLDGHRVRLQGSLIYRDGETMIELADTAIEKISDEINRPASAVVNSQLGQLTAVGEIVDSKCFLGVMNPGNLKTHKACAIRCISGGIPPVFVVKSGQGPAKYFLLISADGQTVNQQVLSMIAEPVKITGSVERQGDLLFLRADPATYEVQ